MRLCSLVCVPRIPSSQPLLVNYQKVITDTYIRVLWIPLNISMRRKLHRANSHISWREQVSFFIPVRGEVTVRLLKNVKNCRLLHPLRTKCTTGLCMAHRHLTLESQIQSHCSP
jgi:hypothetical protein